MFCSDEDENCSVSDDIVSTESCNDNDEDDSNSSEDCLLELTNLLNESTNDDEVACSCDSSDLQVDDNSDDSLCDATPKPCENDLDNVESLLEQVICDEIGTSDGSDDNTLVDCLNDLNHDQDYCQSDLDETKCQEDECQEDECPPILPNSDEDTIESDDLCNESFSCDFTDINDTDNECEADDITDVCSQEPTSQCDLEFTETKLDNLRNMKVELDAMLKEFLNRIRCINAEIENLNCRLSKLLKEETKKDIEDLGVCPTFEDETNANNCRKGKKRNELGRLHYDKIQKPSQKFKAKSAENPCEQDHNFDKCQDCPKFPNKDRNSSKRKLEGAYACPSKKRRSECHNFDNKCQDCPKFPNKDRNSSKRKLEGACACPSKKRRSECD